MSAVRGALVTGLALIAEEVLVTSKGGPAAVSGAFGLLARTINRFADPTVALIPDRSGASSSTSSSPASSTTSKTPATSKAQKVANAYPGN